MNVVEDVKHTEYMANILLTTDCQRNCSYCFAKSDRNRHMKITWEDFITATNFIATMEPKLVNLMGGEPTLHEDFPRMLEYLIVNDFIIQVFTNGMADEECLDKIDKVLKRSTLRKDQLKFAVNVNREKERQKGETEKQESFFNRFYKLSFPSFTIHEIVYNFSFLVDLIHKFQLDPAIRLGLAMPIIDGQNKYLPINHYEEVAKGIVELANNSEGITIAFDCGFPLCMFNMSDIQTLSQNEENDFMFVCGQPIDIYPDLTATNCYPLSRIWKTNINEHKNISELYNYFKDGFSTPTGIYGEKCLQCHFFRKVCFGGCKAFYKTNQQKDGEK